MTDSKLEVSGVVPGLDQAGFQAAAETAEQGCPISNAIRNNVAITVTATLQRARAGSGPAADNARGVARAVISSDADDATRPCHGL